MCNMHDTLLACFLQNSMLACCDTAEQRNSTFLRETINLQQILEKLKKKKIAMNSEYRETGVIKILDLGKDTHRRHLENADARMRLHSFRFCI